MVALVGAANSGKTTLFNQLTDSHYATVNYPGSTVEFALGTGRNLEGFSCRVMDTPGLTSLLPASPDEEVTIRTLFGGRIHPDHVVAVVDANQLSRHLYLVRQLKELGLSPIVAMTMMDIMRSKGKRVDLAALSRRLGCPVLELDPRDKSAAVKLARALGAQACEPAAADCNCNPRAWTDAALRNFTDGVNEARIAEYYRELDLLERDTVMGTGSQAAPAHAAGSVDGILLHPVYGLLLFAGAMFAIFTAIFWLATPFMDFIDAGFALAVDATKNALPASWMTDLLADGLIGGVGAVAVFLPQIVILFLAMGYLEDSGYLARGAALVDRPLSKIGLNGKSFVPLLSGYACAIPAMMAARTIPNRFERNLTIFIIPLMSCSARLPVYALLLAFLTPRDKPWIGGLALSGLYFGGFGLGAAVSTLLSRGRADRGPTGFILELPALKRPVTKFVLSSTYHKARQYVRKAGLTIIAISIGLWVLTHTPPPDIRPGTAAESREYVAMTGSYAAELGRFLEPVTRPMGLDWRGGVALISGFAAREVFVSAMALMYRIDEGDEGGIKDHLLTAMAEVRFEDTGERIFTISSVLGIIIFFMIALQCFPTVAVSRHETGGWRIPAFQLLLYTGGAYALSVLCVQGLRFLGFP